MLSEDCLGLGRFVEVERAALLEALRGTGGARYVRGALRAIQRMECAYRDSYGRQKERSEFDSGYAHSGCHGGAMRVCIDPVPDERRDT